MAKSSQDDAKAASPSDSVLLSFGNRVREARKRADMTQAELAAAAGLSQPYIFEVETRGSNMSLKGMISIANACKVSLKDLIPDTEFDAAAVTVIPVVDLIVQLMEVLSVRRGDIAKVTLQLNGYLDIAAQIRQLASVRH